MRRQGRGWKEVIEADGSERGDEGERERGREGERGRGGGLRTRPGDGNGECKKLRTLFTMQQHGDERFVLRGQLEG